MNEEEKKALLDELEKRCQYIYDLAVEFKEGKNRV